MTCGNHFGANCNRLLNHNHVYHIIAACSYSSFTQRLDHQLTQSNSSTSLVTYHQPLCLLKGTFILAIFLSIQITSFQAHI
jgi:hypothetical protein